MKNKSRNNYKYWSLKMYIEKVAKNRMTIKNGWKHIKIKEDTLEKADWR